MINNEMGIFMRKDDELTLSPQKYPYSRTEKTQDRWERVEILCIYFLLEQTMFSCFRWWNLLICVCQRLILCRVWPDKTLLRTVYERRLVGWRRRTWLDGVSRWWIIGSAKDSCGSRENFKTNVMWFVQPVFWIQVKHASMW